MRKDVKGVKRVLAEIDASILAYEKANAESNREDWAVMEIAVLTLLRCFKYVFEHNLEGSN